MGGCGNKQHKAIMFTAGDVNMWEPRRSKLGSIDACVSQQVFEARKEW